MKSFTPETEVLSVDSSLFEYLSSTSFFRSAPDAVIEQLALSARRKVVSKYLPIYKEGEPSTYIYFLLSGVVKITRHADDGREVILKLNHDNTVFGLEGLAGEKTRRESASTMDSECEIIMLPLAQVNEILLQHSDICFRVMRFIGREWRKAQDQYEAVVSMDARSRIIEFLKQNALTRGRRIGYEWLIKHCLTQQDIANLTGTSRQTVTSVLNDLRKANLIYFKRKSILIRDLSALE